ncbi:MAG: acyltransferase family protein [Bacillota bacterium]|nr:acyltransferase family protein [Bacillota bacterium]
MKKQIYEIYWIRAIACLSVVFIHSLTKTYTHYDVPESTVQLLQTIQILLMFATPMFILISEIISSKVYPNSLPKSFFKKRFQFLLLPYLLTPFLYGLYHLLIKNASIEKVKGNILDDIFLGAWHGYFIVIILQFMFIHWIYIKWFKNVSAWFMLSLTFAINTGYLYVANYQTEWLPQVMQEWLPFVRMPFIGWIFYFTVAYYVGRYLTQLKENRKWAFPLSLVATGITGYLLVKTFTSGTYTLLSSVRLDIMFYTVSLFFALFYLFSFIPKVPRVIMFISKYSFQIFLLHYLSFNLINLVLPEMNIKWYAISLFLSGVLGSILLARIINILPFGKYFVGPIRSTKKG